MHFTKINPMNKKILNKFRTNLPNIYKMATESSDDTIFCTALREHALSRSNEAANQILEMLENESKYIYELSRGENIFIETFSLLWNFLNNKQDSFKNEDLFEDLYHLLKRAEGTEKETLFTLSRLQRHMKRWPTGLDKEIVEYREFSKNRIINLLIQKIEKRGATSSRYHFQENQNIEQKRELVSLWWNDFRFHLSMAIKSPSELNLFMGGSLSKPTMNMLNKAKSKKIPFFITPYYLSLLNTGETSFDDNTIRSYVMYSESLIETYGNIKAWEREDTVVPGEPNAAGWLLPDGHNIHRRYPEVAIMIPDTRGRSCGGLCASCQRMYDFQSERLNFDMDALKPQLSWDKKLASLMDYFEYDSQLRDILITGGDALMSSNKALEKILDAVYRMAKRKQKDNLNRADGDKFYEIQRVRLGSRLLAYLPMRVDDELISILKNFRKKAESAGIKQFVIQTHFQSPLEITVEAKRTIEALLSAGWTISNQLVFTAAASRRGHTAKLRQTLNSLGVVTYYTFTVKGFEENSEVYAPNGRSMQEQLEEKSFGRMTTEQQRELNAIFEKGDNIAKNLNSFMKRNALPFLPTDRNVLNIPAIGKSMTFKLAGISAEGRRILKFDHDHTREHSPIIDRMGEVYIIENRSIASYLRELEKMGESTDDYASVWRYTSGDTEQVFPLFDYPDPGFKPTRQITNFRMTT